MELSLDVVRLIVPRLSLWDARSLQLAHPSFVELVHEATAHVVELALAVPRPGLIDAFLDTRPGFRERVHGDFVMFRTPKDLTMQHVRGGVAVTMHLMHPEAKPGAHARVELRVCAGAPWPTFDTLKVALTVLRWYADALRLRGVRHLEFGTKARLHHPVSEVVNTVATAFAHRHLEVPPTKSLWPRGTYT